MTETGKRAQTQQETADHQNLEDKLRHLAGIVETSQDAIIGKTLDGIITSWNKGAEQIYGYTAKEMIGRSITRLAPPDRPHEIPEFLEKLKQGKRIEHFETVRLRKDGTSRHISLTVSPLTDAAGNITGAAAIGRDITARKQTEQRFRLIVEAIPNAIVVVNQKAEIVLVNSQTETLFGYDAGELMGQPVELLVPEHFRPGHRHDRTDYLASPQARAMGAGRDLSAVRKDGREVPVEIGLSPIETEEGLWVLSAIVNITKRKQVEEEIEQSRRWFERIAQTTPDIIFVLDIVKNRNIYANKSILEVLGYSPEEFRQLPEILEKAISPDDLSKAEEFYRNMADAKPGEVRLLIHRTLHKDGTVGWLEARVTPFTWDETGNLKEVIGLARDITERKQAEWEIKRLNQELEARVTKRTAQLEATNQELEAFSYSVSHDLRTPLRAIDGFSRILLEDYAAELSPQAQRYLRLVHQNTKQMGELIDDLLIFSRLSRQSLHKQSVSPDTLVRRALEELQANQDERRVDLTVGNLPPCQADPAMLKQVWLNLLDNALKYTRKREVAVIKVGSRSENGQTVYFVRDNGVGFDMEYKHKLFGVFQRLHRAEDYEGTGVGLATVQRIIHRHGGRIWAEAEVDKGATFYFTIENQGGQ